MRLLLLLAFGLALGCTRETAIAVVLETGGAGAAAVAFELEVRNGACPTAEDFALGRPGGVTVTRQTFAEGMGMRLGPLDPGTYAFIALGRAADCTPALFGCVERAVGADRTLRIPMVDPEWSSAARCPAGTSCAGAGVCAIHDGGAPTCTEDSDCGPPAVVRCASRACVPRTPVVRALTDFPDNPFLPPLSITSATDPGGATWIHVGLLHGLEGSRAAFIESFPLDELDVITALRLSSPSEDAGLVDASSFDLRSRGTSIGWSLGGTSADPLFVAWVGSLATPGGVSVLTPLRSGEAQRPVGPQIMVGGEGLGRAGAPLYYVTRTVDIGTGAAEMGGLLDGAFGMSDYLRMGGMIPRPEGLRGSGSLGSWLVMEAAVDGDLILWRPVDEAPFERLERSGRGRPTLAHLEGTAYALAYATEGGVALTRLTCDTSCDVASARPLIHPAEGTVSHASITELPRGAFLAVALATPGGVVIRGRVFDASLVAVELGALELYALDSGDVVHDLASLAVVDEGALHLIVAAIVGPPAGGNQLVLADAAFAP